jgi:hypothetical protein
MDLLFDRAPKLPSVRDSAFFSRCTAQLKLRLSNQQNNQKAHRRAPFQDRASIL